MDGYMRIGQVARMSGLSIKAIRHYEAVGVLPAPLRSERGYRLYGQQDLRRLRLVKVARQLGFRLREASALVNLADAGCCATVRPGIRTLVDEKLRQIDGLMMDLQNLKSHLMDYAGRLPAGAEDVLSCAPDSCVPEVEAPIVVLVEGVSQNGRFPMAGRGVRPKG